MTILWKPNEQCFVILSRTYYSSVDKCCFFRSHKSPAGNPYVYNSYGVTCTEVELDVLTGERQIIRTDILFDCGERYPY